MFDVTGPSTDRALAEPQSITRRVVPQNGLSPTPVRTHRFEKAAETEPEKAIAENSEKIGKHSIREIELECPGRQVKIALVDLLLFGRAKA